MTGVSIGAINAAIIAGNPREQRLEKLRAFWERITDRHVWAYTPDGDIYRRARNATSAMMTMTLGQPGFFKPHDVNPWLNFAGAKAATSFYDSAPLAATLNEFVDFSLINDGNTRFAVGAVNVLNGNFIYFDNRNEEDRGGAHHGVAARCRRRSLWSRSAPIIIGTEASSRIRRCSTCWTRTICAIRSSSRSISSRRKAHCRGTCADVLARHKDIMYSSRTRYNTDMYQRLRAWKNRAL